MTSTITVPSTAQSVSTMSTDAKLRQMIDELALTHRERTDYIRTIAVALVSGQHALAVAPGGTGKSYMVSDVFSRITGARTFQTFLDEGSKKEDVFGGLDLKLMTETGRSLHFIEGMLPTADLVEIDEIFNANVPLLHSLYRPLNERQYQHGSDVLRIPLHTAIMSSNKVLGEIDVAPLFDRILLRLVLDYVKGRDNIDAIIDGTISRMRVAVPEPPKTTISIDELRQAKQDSLALWETMTPEVLGTFHDLKDELFYRGVTVSTRRLALSMTAVLANAYIAGHSEVKVGDLDVLANIWWHNEEQIRTVREVVLAATNPGEKAALDLLDDLDKLKEDVSRGAKMDVAKQQALGTEVYQAVRKLIADAQGFQAQAEETGASTQRIKEVIHRAVAVGVEAARSMGIPEELAEASLFTKK